MEINEKRINWKKYLLVFLITTIIFASGFYLSSVIVGRKIETITKLQQGLSIDILSLETQFSVLTNASCDKLNESTLTQELYDISQKLVSVENDLGENNTDYLLLKKYYSILEIKHWLLLQKTAKVCKTNLLSIIYFYSDTKNCSTCADQGYILTALREKYPALRVYSFDYNLSLAPLESIKSIYKLKNDLPILVIGDDVYYGFKNTPDLEAILKKYIKLDQLSIGS